MQHIHTEFEQRQCKHHHPHRRTAIDLALPLVQITMPGAGASGLSSPQQVRA
jgi:hypothetical protein